MPTYLVECRGDVREVYIVEAESAADAVENWHSGVLELSEAHSVEGVSAEEVQP